MLRQRMSNIKREYEKYLVVYYNFNGIQIPFYWDVSESTAKPIDYTEAISEEATLRTFETDYFRWQAKYDISIDGVTIKKKTRIDFID